MTVLLLQTVCKHHARFMTVRRQFHAAVSSPQATLQPHTIEKEEEITNMERRKRMFEDNDDRRRNRLAT